MPSRSAESLAQITFSKEQKLRLRHRLSQDSQSSIASDPCLCRWDISGKSIRFCDDSVKVCNICSGGRLLSSELVTVPTMHCCDNLNAADCPLYVQWCHADLMNMHPDITGMLLGCRELLQQALQARSSQQRGRLHRRRGCRSKLPSGVSPAAHVLPSAGLSLSSSLVSAGSRTESLEYGVCADTTPHMQVCTGTTGHAEAVKFEYDPEKLDFGDMVRHLPAFAHAFSAGLCACQHCVKGPSRAALFSTSSARIPALSGL